MIDTITSQANSPIPSQRWTFTSTLRGRIITLRVSCWRRSRSPGLGAGAGSASGVASRSVSPSVRSVGLMTSVMGAKLSAPI